MKTLKFKTNINCSGCLAKVTPALDNLEGVNKWEVDITDPNKTLTIKTSQLEAQNIKDTLEKAGFKGQEV